MSSSWPFDWVLSAKQPGRKRLLAVMRYVSFEAFRHRTVRIDCDHRLLLQPVPLFESLLSHLMLKHIAEACLDVSCFTMKWSLSNY